ncbi:MAG: hypothetical protein ABSH08_10595 [Tepidisphaeraceae bacterium]
MHYLQMVTEKLAKAGLANPSDTDSPKTSHNAFVRYLQTLKGRAFTQRQLGYASRKAYRKFIDSILPQAHEIERLAPSVAAMTQPNPEYPWRDPRTGDISAPADYDFPELDPLRSDMLKIEKMIEQLLVVLT